MKLLFEGMFYPIFNQLTRIDSVTAYLHLTTPPFNIIDSAKSRIDSVSFSGLFKFSNVSAGNFYISVKHLNSLETWSKAGGEYLANDGTFYNYDFTTFNTQAYGNNLILKGSKYCLFSGDLNHDGFIDLEDLVPVFNDATDFLTGRYLTTDLNGDSIVDLTDITISYKNSINFVRVIHP